MSGVYWWIPFGLNFILYGICCLLIIKRKTYTMISIRSPTLLLSTILGNFLMSLVIILFKITGQNFFSSFYYIFRVMMIVSLFLRYERIILCCGIDKNDENDLKQFSTKRYLYIEKFYVRILIVIFFIFLVITILTRALKKEYFEVFFTNKDIHLNETKSWIWVIWNFLEGILILTYLFRIYGLINLQQYIRFELYSFLIVWFIYTNCLSIIAYNNRNDMDDSNTFAIVTLTILYVCLIINGYLPVILSYTSRTLVLYRFTNKLLTNLYLFLSDESCYESFNNYLIKRKTKDDNCPIYLKLYTHIMKYKLFFVLNPNMKALGQNEARKIYNTFFEDETYSRFFDQDIILKIRREANTNLNNKNFFDEALQYAFNKLSNYFNDYKNSREYNILQAKISLESYVRCKMVNSGLINKF